MSAVKIHQLELHNFKSYLGTIVVGPFKSFSCVVGPNGSGKSNIMDALCFLLGNKSTALRGMKITDIINRKAALSKDASATVTLVLRRGEEEIRLARSVNIKGTVSVVVDQKKIDETEFSRILRQLHISHRINTFLVFQHEVEAIAQMKANNITELLEQLSGSVELKEEYESKKRALEEALQEVYSATMEKRSATAEVNQMRLHKKEAEKFNAVDGELTLQKRNLALAELFYIEMQLTKKKSDLVNQNKLIQNIEQNFASESEMKKLKSNFAAKHKTFLTQLQENRELTAKSRKIRSLHDTIQASISHFEKRTATLSFELNAAKSSNASRLQETSRLTEHLKRQEASLLTFDKQCEDEDMKDTDKGKLTESQLKEYYELKRDADCKTITQRQELDTVRRRFEMLSQGLKQIQLSKESHEAAKKALSTNIEHHTQRISEIENKLEETKDNTREIEKEYRDTLDSLNSIREGRKDLSDELRKLENQLHELRFVKEDNRHNQRTSDTLQSLKSMFHGVKGRLVDLCVPHEGYRIAVTVAFGKNLEAVVVDTTETALGCVRYLKEQRLSTMTFIPLDNAQGKSVDDRLRSFGGSCKPVADVLRYDILLEPAIRYAIGQTLVCDDMEEARKVAYGQQERFKVVTRHGNVLLKNGSIQGGLAAVQSRAKKWDEKKFDDLKQAHEKVMERLRGGSDVDETRVSCAARDLEARLETSKKHLVAYQADIESLKAQITSMEARVAKEDVHINDLAKRLEQHEGAIQTCQGDMDVMQKSISKVESSVFAVFQKTIDVADISEMERKNTLRLRIRAEQRQKYIVAIQKLKLSIEAESKRIGLRHPQELEDAFNKSKKQLESCKSELKNHITMLEDEEKKVAILQSSISDSKKELNFLEDSIRNNINRNDPELMNARKRIKVLQAICDALRQQRIFVIQRCKMEEINLPTRDAESMGQKRRREFDSDEMNLSEPFESGNDTSLLSTSSNSGGKSGGESNKKTMLCIDFSPLDETTRHKLNDFSTFKQQAEALIAQTHRELEAIAPNLKAATKFGSSEKKLDKSSNQFEESREKHRSAIVEFNKVKEARKHRFNDTFEKISENVDRIYRELTKGTRAHDVHGSAYLMLENSEEPYMGGTKYHAVPPMKRFMTIEALSGGERTMAALALLFAIHAISPTPFFVLDEVDAALDIGNVLKLAEYLRNNCGQCQFIVVSLKEQLYHNAESLIGVYKDRERESSGILTLDMKGYTDKF